VSDVLYDDGLVRVDEAGLTLARYYLIAQGNDLRRW
jgi:hypothetical protein